MGQKYMLKFFLLFLTSNYVNAQFLDFFSSLQQFNRNYQNDGLIFPQYHEPHRQKDDSRTPNARAPARSPNRNKQNQKVIQQSFLSPSFNFFTTTAKPHRKTTKHSSHTTEGPKNHRNSATKQTTRPSNLRNEEISFPQPVSSKNDRRVWNDGVSKVDHIPRPITGGPSFQRDVNTNVDNKRKNKNDQDNYEVNKDINTVINDYGNRGTNKDVNYANDNYGSNLNNQGGRETTNSYYNNREINNHEQINKDTSLHFETSSSRNRNEHEKTTNDYNNGVTNNYGNTGSNNDYYNNNRGQNRKPVFGLTTHNPPLKRPGVKPASVDLNSPPITNKPVIKRPYPDFNENSNDDTPQILVGPDEDRMSQVEKRRYAEMAERMCDKYKSMMVRKIEAIPLVPSPQPVQVNVTDCRPITVPLVIGGKVASIQEFPHMALIGWAKIQESGYAWKCGGSLLSDQYVLTAAHCSYQDKDDSVVFGPPQAVQLGSTYMDDPRALVVKISAVIRHPKYKPPRKYYDLALIKLANKVKFSESIRPACLGTPPRVGKPIIATGWGRTEFGGDQSLELRSVSLPIWDMQECHEVLGTSRRLPVGPSSESQICAGDKRGGKDTCQGDSGGPAQIQDGCVWRVVAVTSLGRACGAPHTPALYATVQPAFIAAQIFSDQLSQRLQNTRDSDDSRPSGYNRESFQQNRRPDDFVVWS